jgi:hypothetical protein
MLWVLVAPSKSRTELKPLAVAFRKDRAPAYLMAFCSSRFPVAASNVMYAPEKVAPPDPGGP